MKQNNTDQTEKQRQLQSVDEQWPPIVYGLNDRLCRLHQVTHRAHQYAHQAVDDIERSQSKIRIGQSAQKDTNRNYHTHFR